MPEHGYKQEGLELEVRGMKLKEEEDVDMDSDNDNDSAAPSLKQEPFARVAALRSSTSTPTGSRRQAQSPASAQGLHSSASSPNIQETVGGDVSVKLEDGRPKLSRSTTQKVEKRAAQLFWDHEDATSEACSTFDKLTECTYANKNLGITEHALECDCSEEWGKEIVHSQGLQSLILDRLC
jgi:histone-lysine N-methyltransferase SETD2